MAHPFKSITINIFTLTSPKPTNLITPPPIIFQYLVNSNLNSTLNNITVTQVNVKSAESQIRDVDFASESANLTY